MPINLEERQLLERLASNGPQPADYPLFTALLTRAFERTEHARGHFAMIRDVLADTLDVSTMQGFALRKPHGYPGDFEIIDRIYVTHRATEPRLARWDEYFHAQPATRAVCNRKAYFHRLLDRLAACNSARVLNVASGPCRDVREWLRGHPQRPVRFDCIDMDEHALQYASRLCAGLQERICWTRANAFRFRPSEQYDLIWVAGLCDYFSDARVVRLISRLAPALRPGAELVLGNFGPGNPSRAYMEIIGEWTLQHRSASRLCALAQEAGIREANVRIGAEPQGVNLFLHIRNDDA
jgi:SAM-dependent methyltransferase